MFRLNFNKRERKIFIVLVVISIIYVGHKGFYVPMEMKAASLKNDITAAQNKLSKAQRIIRQRKGMQEEYGHLLAHFSQDAADEGVMSEVFSEIEGIAKRLDMNIDDLKFNKVKKTDAHNTFSLDLSVNGEFVTVMNFIHELQSYPHEYFIDGLHLKKFSKEEKAVQCRLQLSRILISP